eukprot:TRINITY_DN4763_c0_g2_i1.p1 TRINITY_DN4763_c0_g2~~TRINITY_DN4763_c0_g2_i1.p1  ORF type:complete len:277 (-),score=50.82 TRINITY_DN4763_c0_g2_i1:175-945(-)
MEGLDKECLGRVDRLNVHGYYRGGGCPPGNWIDWIKMKTTENPRKKMHRLAKRLGKGIWQSEAGPLGMHGDDELQIALQMATNICSDINQLHVSAWCYWQALEPSGTWWGLLQAAGGSFSYDRAFTFRIMKQFYIIQHFSRWIRPQCNILKIGPEHMEDCVVAAWSALTAHLVIVITNTHPSKALEVSFPLVQRFKIKTSSAETLGVKGFRTSSMEDFVEISGSHNIVLPGLDLTVYVSSRSICTFVIGPLVLRKL